MRSQCAPGVLTLCISVCACVEIDDTSIEEQAGTTVQGTTVQGTTVQGTTVQGMSLQGFLVYDATLGGAPLTNLHIERGEVVANRGSTTLRGTALTGALLQAQAQNLSVSPPATALLTYRITAIAPESSAYDPTQTGGTFVYTLDQRVAETGSWSPACPADAQGSRVAIPIAAIWNARGDRIESSSMFTFGCSIGVLAKCYRWGYKPWLTGYGADMPAMHQTCTRAARADYCGDGVPHTRDGTKINLWDTLSAPGPIQTHGGLLAPIGMIFEAGWSTDGAVCLSHARWFSSLGSLLAGLCPDRLVLPGLGGIACDSVADVLLLTPSTKLFDEAYVNIGL